MSFIRNVSGLLLTTTVNLPIGVATSIVLARFLLVEERGVYSVATAFAAIVCVVGQFGWPSSSIYRIRRAAADPALVASLAIVVLGGISVLLAAGCWVFQEWIRERFLGGAPPIVLAAALITVPWLMLANVFASISRATDRFAVANWFSFLQNVGILAVLCGVLVLRDGGLVDALVGVLAVRALVTAGFVGVVLRETGITLRLRFDEVRETLRFGLKSYVQGLAFRLHERIDVMMLAYLLQDPAPIAFYTIAKGVVERLKMIPDSLGKAAFPQMAGDTQRVAAEFASRICRQTVLWMVPTVVGLAIAGPYLIPLLFGENYIPSMPPFRVLLPAMAFFSIYIVLSRFFNAINRQQFPIVTQVLSLLVNVTLNLVWIPRYGLMGAAYANLVTYVLESLLITAVFSWLTATPIRRMFVFERADLETYQRLLGRVWGRIGRG